MFSCTSELEMTSNWKSTGGFSVSYRVNHASLSFGSFPKINISYYDIMSKILLFETHA